MRNDFTYIHHILDCIENIEVFIKDIKYSDFRVDVMLQSAVLYQFMVLGEATGNISKEFQDKYPAIPWKSIIGMRNKMIHQYFGVDFEVVWETIHKDLPELKALLENKGLK